MSNGHYVVPKLVQDNTLKSLITTVNGEDALKVKEVAQGEVDLDPVTDALGDPSDSTYSSGDGTVISLLKGIYEDFHPPTPTPPPIVSGIYRSANRLTGWQNPASNISVPVPSGNTIVYFWTNSLYFQLAYAVNFTSSNYNITMGNYQYYVIVPYSSWILRVNDQDNNRICTLEIYGGSGSVVPHSIYLYFSFDINSIIN